MGPILKEDYSLKELSAGQKLLRNAIKTVRNFLVDRAVVNQDSLKKFVSYFLRNLGATRYSIQRTGGSADAGYDVQIELFLLINDRRQPLTFSSQLKVMVLRPWSNDAKQIEVRAKEWEDYELKLGMHLLAGGSNGADVMHSAHTYLFVAIHNFHQASVQGSPNLAHNPPTSNLAKYYGLSGEGSPQLDASGTEFYFKYFIPMARGFDLLFNHASHKWFADLIQDHPSLRGPLDGIFCKLSWSSQLDMKTGPPNSTRGYHLLLLH